MGYQNKFREVREREIEQKKRSPFPGRKLWDDVSDEWYKSGKLRVDVSAGNWETSVRVVIDSEEK